MSEQQGIDRQLREKILAATDNGLQIICDLTRLHPSSVKEVGNRGFSKKSFRSPFRPDDDHPSASMYKGDKGVWGIKDFATGQWMDCFDFFMREENIHNFYMGLLELARKYNVEVEGKVSPRKPTFEKLLPERIAEIIETSQFFTTDKQGVRKYFHIEFNEEFSDSDFYAINPKAVGSSESSKEFRNKLQEAFEHYDLKSVKFYEIVKVKGDTVSGYRKSSHEGYPIMAFHMNTWGKTYEPYASEWTTKEGEKMPPQRFQHYGQKPNRYIYGLDQLSMLVTDTRQTEFERLLAEATTYAEGDKSKEAKRERTLLKNKAYKKKLPYVIWCSGGSDGFNIKAMGSPAIFSNSESELLMPDEMRKVLEYAEEVYYVHDQDKTGITKAHEIALMYLHVRIVPLPSDLSERTNWQKKACKDVKDFARYYSPSDFKGLLNVAYAYQFWSPRIDAKGQMRGYDFDIVNARHFLYKQGFYKYPNHTDKLQYEIVKESGHIVSVQDGVVIKNYLETFCYETRQEKAIVATVMKAKIVSEQLIHSLPHWHGQFTRGGKDFHMLFFKNKAWKVSIDTTTEVKPSDGKFSVWENEVLFSERTAPELRAPFFTAKKIGDKIELTVNSQDNPIMQFLINSSRIYWKKEFDMAGVGYYENNEFYKKQGLNTLTGKHLSPDEQQEQVLHFLSKCAALGYFYHSYKQASKAWLVWCTDNNERELNQSFGRTGKSIFGRCVKELLPTEYFEGRKVDVTTLFHLQRVNDRTRCIWYDDVSQGFTIDAMFSSITGPMKVESKHGKAVEIPFQLSPKYLVTSNFNLKSQDPSTLGRLWVLGWSDFYHGASKVHPGSKTVREDLQRELFDDFKQDDWDSYINFIKDCVQLWLSLGRIDPPMRDIKKQTLKSIMGANFEEWAESFILPRVNYRAAGTDEPSKLKAHENDWFIPKSIAEESYAKFLKDRNQRFERADSQSFRLKLEAWTEYNGFVMDPNGLKNTRKAIEKRMDERHKSAFQIPDNVSVLHCHFILGYKSHEEIIQIPTIPNPNELPF